MPWSPFSNKSRAKTWTPSFGRLFLGMVRHCDECGRPEREHTRRERRYCRSSGRLTGSPEGLQHLLDPND
jgi:hypothetical protein